MKPNAIELKWLERVVDFANQHGCFPLMQPGAFQIHHVVGRSGRENKIHIGHWFILPVHFDYHDVNSMNPLNVTHFRRRFTEKFSMQKELFKTMVEKITEEDGENPVPEDVLNAIMNTRY